MQELYELKDMLCDELKEYGKKGDLTAGSLDVVDKLSHTIKNLDKIIEKCEEEDYSGAYDHPMNRDGSYARGGRRGANQYGSYGMGSYAQRRDSRGRYSNMDGYSRHEDMLGELRYLMQNAPDEHTKMEFQKFITKMEQTM